MKPSNNVIALLILFGAVSLMVFIFAESRNDPSLRMAAIVSACGTVASLTAIASTILVGKDVTKPEPPEGTQNGGASQNPPPPNPNNK